MGIIVGMVTLPVKKMSTFLFDNGLRKTVYKPLKLK